MSDERRHPISDDDVERIASAVAEKAATAFHISDEKHYNDHQRLNKLLEVYENAQSAFWKSFLALVIIGAILLAGIGIAKGVK